jgi:hypothetical protein
MGRFERTAGGTDDPGGLCLVKSRWPQGGAVAPYWLRAVCVPQGARLTMSPGDMRVE